MNRAAAFRKGRIVSAIRSSTAGSEAPEKITRNVAEARILGRKINARLDSYRQAQRDSMISLEEEKRPSDVMDYGEEKTIRARFAPGLILDFPSQRIKVGPFELINRTCLTVCLKERQSKIWARFVVDRIDKKGASDMSEQQIKQFQVYSDALADACISGIQAEYERDFSEAFGEPVKIRLGETLVFLSVDGEYHDSGNKIRAATGALQTSTGRIDVIEDSDLAASLRAVTRAVMPELGTDQTKSSEFKVSEKATLLPHVTSQGTSTIFVVLPREDCAIFGGVAQHRDSEASDLVVEGSQRKVYSYGLDAITELADLFARDL